MAHISRLAAPKSWKLKRKSNKWIARPNPGPHPLKYTVTIDLLLKNLLKYATTTREVKQIINQGKIEIDNKIRGDKKFPVGLMDTIKIKETQDYFRVLIDNKGKLFLNKINKEESSIKPLKIIGKKILKKNKIQLSFLDGRTKLIDKDIYKVTDSIIFDLEKNQIKSHLKLEKGALIYLISGNKIGNLGVIDKIEEGKGLQQSKVIYKMGKDKFETSKEHIFVIGKDKPEINILTKQDGK